MGLSRRQFLLVTGAVFNANSSAAAPVAQRNYRGRLRYVHAGAEYGREWFSVTVQANSGLRTLRAQCEIDPDRILRDVTLTVDAGWRPLTAFIQLTIEGALAGATWFHFTPNEAVAAGYTARGGPFRQRYALQQAVAAFGTHPIHGDAWNLAQLRRNNGQAIDSERWTSSAESNGGTGPRLLLLPKGQVIYQLLGAEAIESAIGRFDTQHFTMTVTAKARVNHIWATGEDCIPVLMTTPDERRYELTELTGDYR